MAAEKEVSGVRETISLALAFLFWYVGNTFYNQYNTMALKACGGKNGGLTMTVSTMQLGVCAAYAMVMWIVGRNPIKLFGLQAPAKMPLPKSARIVVEPEARHVSCLLLSNCAPLNICMCACLLQSRRRTS